MKALTQLQDVKVAWEENAASVTIMSLLVGILFITMAYFVLVPAADGFAARVLKSLGCGALASLVVSILMLASYASRAQLRPELPQGWTDDMRVSLRQGRKDSEAVTLVMDALMDRKDLTSLIPTMRDDFGMTEDDIILAFDRVQGGIVRAITGNPENRPSKRKDPLAWHSFQIVWKGLPWGFLFSTRKKPSGLWHEWFEETREETNNSQQPAEQVQSEGAPSD